MQKYEVGIDTLSYYYGLTPKQNKAILNKLKMLPDFFKKSDYWEETHIYHSNYFQRQGVKLVVSQIKGARWGLLVIIHPALVLGEVDRSTLYQPEKKTEYKSMIKLVDKLLKEVDVPCSVDDMKLYRADVTANFIYDTSTSVSEYIRILKKSRLLNHYHWDKFREDDHTARDCKIANQHSCKQYCKSAAFFAYDKTAQLEMIEAFPDALIGKHILRLEAQLRRKAMKKWVGEDTMEDSNWKIIKELGVNVEKILSWYLERVNPVHGNYIRYKDAVELVSQVKGEKKRERMLYLLRKTSDSENLAAAQEKMKEKFQLSDSQCKTVLNQFQKLGISPVTLTNSSGFERLPGMNLL